MIILHSLYTLPHLPYHYHYIFNNLYKVIGASLKYFLPKLSIITNLIKYSTVSLSCKLVNDGDSPYTPFKYNLIGIIVPG